MLYALAIGAGGDADLDFVHETRGPRVMPTFFAAAAFADACDVVLEGLGLRGKQLVHSDQELIVVGPLPPEGRLSNLLTVVHVHDAGTGAVIDVECTSEVDGRPVSRTRVGLFALGAGGFGGNGAREGERFAPPDRGPDRRLDMSTRQDQALLYRLSFLHPIAPGGGATAAPDPHVDPADARAAGFDAPVMHGICTFGFLCRAALAEIDRIGGGRLSRLVGRFTAPAHPGQTLTALFWHGEQRLVAKMVNDEGAAVISDAAIEYTVGVS
jgi:hypothetical protein